MLGLGKLFDDAPAPSRPLSSRPLGDPWAAMAGTAYKSLRYRYPSILQVIVQCSQNNTQQETRKNIRTNYAQKTRIIFKNDDPSAFFQTQNGEARKLWPDWRLRRDLGQGSFLVRPIEKGHRETRKVWRFFVLFSRVDNHPSPWGEIGEGKKDRDEKWWSLRWIFLRPIRDLIMASNSINSICPDLSLAWSLMLNSPH